MTEWRHMSVIKDILKGILIGIANIIPGVSGGTMAVSMGIYDKIISSITNLFRNFKQSIKTLFPYIIGMFLGIVGLSFFIEFLFEKYPLPTNMLFIGLILGGVPMLFRRLKGKKTNIGHYLLFVIFFSFTIILQLLTHVGETNLTYSFDLIQTIKLFIIGVIASATMVVPGVSGSLILMLLGFYNPIIEAITSFLKALLSFNIGEVLGACAILIPFGIGVVVGIIVIAKLISFLLEKFETHTFSAILGLILSSPIVIFMNATNITINFGIIVASVITLVIGLFISYRLGE